MTNKTIFLTALALCAIGGGCRSPQARADREAHKHARQILNGSRTGTTTIVNMPGYHSVQTVYGTSNGAYSEYYIKGKDVHYAREKLPDANTPVATGVCEQVSAPAPRIRPQHDVYSPDVIAIPMINTSISHDTRESAPIAFHAPRTVPASATTNRVISCDTRVSAPIAFHAPKKASSAVVPPVLMPESKAIPYKVIIRSHLVISPKATEHVKQ